eukprot:TRINITY_DN5315_c0_g1_i1.p1 TRINITY_DN5315_c0_g1~~TRINITY_DN5315_c0_g1_i1.p1  ORF type:complete len:520 (+),score=184.15 TRINITY_DN5315_c0_g1_i1:49-1608(+)
MSVGHSTRRGGASATPAALGRTPPHLLPDREELSTMAYGTPHAQHVGSPPQRDAKFRSPVRSMSHAWTDGKGYIPPPSSVGARSPSPIGPVERGSLSERVVLKASSKQCPYGWHGSPEKVAVVEKPVPVPMRSAEQDSELRLMRQQLQMALEQVHTLKADNTSLRNVVRPNPHEAPPQVIPVEVAGQPIHQFLSKIDEVISHHETVLSHPGGLLSPSTAAALSPAGAASPRAAAAAGGDDAVSAVKLQRQLDASAKQVAAQQTRIAELTARLKHREEHIESLTKSLIDLGQHNARLQAQVRGIVNEPPRTAMVSESAAVEGMPPLAILKKVEEQQRAIRAKDEVALQQFDRASLPRAAAGAAAAADADADSPPAAPAVGKDSDMATILAAIDDHRQRADQIVELNRASRALVQKYQEAEQEKEVVEEPAAEAPEDAGRVPAPTSPPIQAPPPPRADQLSAALAAHGWVPRFDANLQRSYFYNDARGEVCWTVADTGVDLASALPADPDNILSPSRKGDA